MAKIPKILEKVLMILQSICYYLLSVCKQTVGLKLTKVQGVYWRAVQRRMLLGQLEDLINGNIKPIRANHVRVPYELAVALVRRDPAIYTYLVKYLASKRIVITCPKCELEKIQTDAAGSLTASNLDSLPTMMDSFKPDALVKEMKKRNVIVENEEECLEVRGSFLMQSLRAIDELKVKGKKKLMARHSQRKEADVQQNYALQEPKSFDMGDDSDDSDDEDDDFLFEDLIYDKEQKGLIKELPIDEKDDVDSDEDAANDTRWFKIGGKSLRPAWTTITENIPFVVSNFRFKHIVRTKVYSSKKKDQEKEIKRNKEITTERHSRLKEMWKKASRWPLFTYWLMFVQTLILIITLSVYGFGVVGYVPFTEVALVPQTDLSVDVVGKDVTPNIWIGPPQSALILLGANYGPCMRRDRLLFDAIDQDRRFEALESGCCVRRDGSGCVQVPTEGDCPNRDRSADFVFYDLLVDTSLYTNRSVCGTSPRTCLSPPSSSKTWRVDSISDWPICKDAVLPVDINGTNKHLTCEVTGRPCCVGIQAICMITTRENCDFLEGSFHDDAFLCSQVDCLSSLCGLTPFARRDHPDQTQRLGLALFLHAGILHLLITIIFNIIVLRNLEKYLGWLSTAILYLGSGIGGNIVSGIFVPYSPEVGPSAAIFGVIAFFLVFIIYHWDMLYEPLWEMAKYIIIIIILLFVGLLPYLDNFARIGGIVFGMFFSFIHVHYIPPLEGLEEFKSFKQEVESLSITKKQEEKSLEKSSQSKFSDKRKLDQHTLKIAFIVTGLVSVVVLFVTFFVWFYEYQRTWNGFTYFNCIIPTKFSDLCQDFSQNIRQRPSALAVNL